MVEDKLWFYSSYRYWRNDRFVASTFNPDGSQALDPQLFLFYSGTVTGKLNDKNRVSGYIDWNKKQRVNRRDLASTYSFVSPEASFYQRQAAPPRTRNGLQPFRTSCCSKPASQWTGSYGTCGISRPSDPARCTNDISLSTLTGAAVNELTHDTPTRRNGAFAVSWLPKFAGSHNVRAGVEPRSSRIPPGMTAAPTGTWWHGTSMGLPLCRGLQHPGRCQLHDVGLCGLCSGCLDAESYDRGAGVRYERWTGRINPQSDPAGTFVPARSFDAIAGPGWNSVVPRLSVVYDVFGTGKTAIKASASKYMQQQAASLLSNLNPMRLLSEVRTWKDANVDGVAGDGNWSQSGWARRGRQLYDGSHLAWPYQWELTAIVEQQLFRSTGVALNYYHRRYSQLTNLQNVALSQTTTHR